MAPAIFGKLKYFVEKGIDGISILFFVIIFFVALSQITMRWVFRNPIIWSEELIRLMYIWICYMGWTLASRYKTYIRITFLIDSFPPIPKKLIETVNCLLIIVFSAFMVYYGSKMTMIASSGKGITVPISFAFVYVIAPVTNFIILMYQLVEIVSIWKNPASAAGPNNGISPESHGTI